MGVQVDEPGEHKGTAEIDGVRLADFGRQELGKDAVLHTEGGGREAGVFKKDAGVGVEHIEIPSESCRKVYRLSGL